MKLRYKDLNNKNICCLYWAKNLALEEFEKELSQTDLIQVWYPAKVDESIRAKYGDVISYISLGGDWDREEHSREIDLRLSAEEIYGGMSSNRRYQVRRANNIFNIVSVKPHIPTISELKDFINYFNKFAAHKGLVAINENKLYAAREEQALFISSSMYEEEAMTMHAYLRVAEENLVTLMNSCQRKDMENNSQNNNIISASNIKLHYDDMLSFKEQGLERYDLGGFRIKEKEICDPKEEALLKIADFKEKLGGATTTYSAGFVIDGFLLRKLEKNIKLIADMVLDKKLILWGYGKYGKFSVKKLRDVGIKPHMIIDKNFTDQVEDEECTFSGISGLGRVESDESMILICTDKPAYEDIMSDHKLDRFARTGNVRWIME